MFRNVLPCLIAPLLCLALSGCESLILPDFNGGVLNPDIRFLRAGEVMNGVKCAMTEFMREREIQVFNERRKAVFERSTNPRPFLALYTAEYPKTYSGFERADRRHGYKQRNDTGDDNPFSPYSIHVDQMHISKVANPAETDPVKNERQCNPVDDQFRHVSETFMHWESDPKCAGDKTKCPDLRRPHCVSNKYYCPAQLGIVVWDYAAKDVYGNNPGDQLHPGIGNCVPVPDYSRFALDYTQQATIELQLTATNQGTAFYDTINAAGLGPLKSIVAPGSRVTGAVFPKADFTEKGLTTFDMSVQMPQTLFLAPAAEEQVVDQAAEPKASPDSANRDLSQKITGLHDQLKSLADRLGRPKAQPFETVEKNLNDAIGTASEIIKGLPKDPSTHKPLWTDAINSLTQKAKDARKDILEQILLIEKNISKSTYEFAQKEALNALLLKLKKKSDDIAPSLREFAPALPQEFSKKITPPRAFAPSVKGEQPKAGRSMVPPEGSSLAGGSAGTNGQSTAKNEPGKSIFTKQELDLARKSTPLALFSSGCGVNGVMHIDDTTDLDYLALKDLLMKIVTEQNDQVTYRGGPEISLDTLTLTTSFEIILDLSAGTKHIFRLFPMVTPPQMGMKGDHTHQLRITLHGVKKKGDPNGAANLEKSCIERVTRGKKSTAPAQPGGTPTDAKTYCASAQGKLLEAIIEATTDNKGSGSGGGSSGQ